MLCACLGPQRGDQYCPCVMKAKGLKMNEPSPEEVAKSQAALEAFFDKYSGIRQPPIAPPSEPESL